MAKSRRSVDPGPGSAPDGPRIERIAVADLVPDLANVRKRTDRNKATIKNSLKRFGAGRSILLDKDNVIVAGNGVAEQAAEAGIAEILVVDARPDQLVAVRRSDWTKTEATAAAIADNRSSELAEWNFEDLGKQLSALQDDGFCLAEIGWEPHEVEPLLGADWSPAATGEMPRGAAADRDARGDDNGHPYTVCFAPDKWEVIERACERVRAIEDDESIPAARCLELIAADWMNDPNWHEAVG